MIASLVLVRGGLGFEKPAKRAKDFATMRSEDDDYFVETAAGAAGLA